MDDIEEDKVYWKGIFDPLTLKKLSKHTLTYHAQAFDKKTKSYAWSTQEDFLFAVNEKAVADFQALGLEID